MHVSKGLLTLAVPPLSSLDRVKARPMHQEYNASLEYDLLLSLRRENLFEDWYKNQKHDVNLMSRIIT